MKDLVFISHSTPEDNYSAGWLASKLQLLGYRVFIDLDNLRAGDTFYTVIQPKIQNEAIKFIAINTESYIKKAADPNSGVRKEINAAATVRADLNFIIPIRFDKVDFNSFPMDYVGRKAIDFNERWFEGLQELAKELEEFNIPKTAHAESTLQLWHKAISSKNNTIDRQETILSNWYPVHLPQYIYVHKPTLFDKTKLWAIPSTTILEGNHIICFASTETVHEAIDLSDSKKYLTKDFIESEEIVFDEELKISRPYDKLKNLLNKSFRGHCKHKKLKEYKQAGEKEVFYFQFKEDGMPVSQSLKKYGKTRIQLVGNKWGTNWHFAISAKVELYPFPNYRLFYHVIFTNENYKPLSPEEQHALRRRFSSSLYNKKAFESSIGSMLALSPNSMSEHISIRTDKESHMLIDNFPFNLISNTSYIEPGTEI